MTPSLRGSMFQRNPFTITASSSRRGLNKMPGATTVSVLLVHGNQSDNVGINLYICEAFVWKGMVRKRQQPPSAIVSKYEATLWKTKRHAQTFIRVHQQPARKNRVSSVALGMRYKTCDRYTLISRRLPLHLTMAWWNCKTQ